jgi:PadR family transcriptional regulator, regulatory protein PadR
LRTSATQPPLRTPDLLVLIVLADGPQHGYAIAQEIRTRTREQLRIRAGDLYRVLYRMDRAGLIEPAPASSRRRDADERRVDYRITPLGRRVAQAQATLIRDLCAGVLRRAATPRGVR